MSLLERLIKKTTDTDDKQENILKDEGGFELELEEETEGDFAEEAESDYTEEVESSFPDTEMTEMEDIEQEPVYYEDEVLGRFELNRALGVYEQTIERYGAEIRLVFKEDEEEQMQMAVETARTLLSNLEFWMEEAAVYAVDKLLARRKLELPKEETEVTRDNILAALWLNDIWVMPSGTFQFWYDDGGMFGGHSIYVDGNVYGKFTGVGP